MRQLVIARKDLNMTPSAKAKIKTKFALIILRILFIIIVWRKY